MPEGPRELRLVVTAPDYDSALRFYRDVLGLRPEASFEDDNGGRATLLHAGRATIELADDLHAVAIDDLEVGRRVAGPVRLAFEVADPVQTTERLVAAGARLVSPPMRTPWGSVNARLDGPDGQHLTVYGSSAYVADRPRLDGQVVLVDPDPAWPAVAAELSAAVRASLGPAALVLEHVGSTSVPGLPAKPVIDLVLGVPDPTDEASYVSVLEGLGYHLHIREPEWHQHRLLKRENPTVNLHVFAADSDEIARMVDFREHLRRDATDRDLYLRSKRELAGRTWAYTQDYADAKSDVVADIMSRALTGAEAALTFTVVPVAEIHNDRHDPQDTDHWGAVESLIVADARFGDDCMEDLSGFSHVAVVFGHRGPRRAHRIGVTVARVVSVRGRHLRVRGLDAIDGTPVLDLKPVMRDFVPRDVQEPEWPARLLRDY